MGVPENIDALLVDNDIPAEYLAQIAGVDPSTVSRWRKGSSIRRKNLESICEYFAISLDDIVSDEYGYAAKVHGSIPKAAAKGLSSDEKRLLEIYRQCNQDGKDAILETAKSMLKLFDAKNDEVLEDKKSRLA